MLFDSSTTYASGQPHGDTGYSAYQDVSWLGKYHLDKLGSPNLLIGITGLAVIAYLVHRHGGRR